jgi:hypothetical protein
VLAARPDGWRRGWAVLARRGMAAWITTRAAADEPAARHGTAAANPRALPLSATPVKGGESSSPARGSPPPAATADIVTVLAAMMLACAS